MEFLICLILVIMAVFVFGRVGHYDFVNYDDGLYVYENQNVKKGLTLQGIRWALFSGQGGNWHPMTWMSHMLDVQLFGMNPGGHHLSNLLLHGLNTLLLFIVFRIMTGAILKSAFVAALFLIHPLHVESVAWISERKDLLSCFWGMLTLGAYIYYVRIPSLIRYIAVLSFFALGLMSKPMLVTLPFVLLLIDFWPLRRLPGDHPPKGFLQVLTKRCIEKIPLFLLSAIVSTVTILMQKSSGALRSLDIYPFHVRLANAVVTYSVYLKKTIWPSKLSVIYPHPGTIHIWQLIFAAAVFTGITYLVFRYRKSSPYAIFGWLWYFGTLVPVIGIVQVGSQAMADRYTYIPLIGIFVLATWGFCGWRQQCEKLPFLTGGIVVLVLIACSVGTLKHLPHWSNSIRLFQQAIEINPNSYVANNNLGLAYMEKGKIRKALTHFDKALKAKPDYIKALNNRGLALNALGLNEEAIRSYEMALAVKPDYGQALFNLGNSLMGLNRIEAAIQAFEKAILVNPSDKLAHNNIGNAFFTNGELKKAIHHYLRGLRIDPNDADINGNLGIAYLKKNNWHNAMRHFNAAVSLNPLHENALQWQAAAMTAHKKLEGLKEEH